MLFTLLGEGWNKGRQEGSKKDLLGDTAIVHARDDGGTLDQGWSGRERNGERRLDLGYSLEAEPVGYANESEARCRRIQAL